LILFAYIVCAAAKSTLRGCHFRGAPPKAKEGLFTGGSVDISMQGILHAIPLHAARFETRGAFSREKLFRDF
jgi:hypothetical protein